MYNPLLERRFSVQIKVEIMFREIPSMWKNYKHIYIHFKNISLFKMQRESLIPLQLLNERLDEETRRIVALETNVCLECGGRLVERDGEFICSKCGLVWSDGFSPGEQIPFDGETLRKGYYESHWNPGSSLSFEKVGTSMSRLQLARIIAVNGTKDLPIRAIHLKTISKPYNNVVLGVLSRGSQLLRKYGFGENHVFAEYLGRVLRRLAILRVLDNRLFRVKWLVNAAFCYTFKKLYPERKLDKIMEELKVEPADLDYIDFILESINPKNWRKHHSKRTSH